MSLPRFLLFGSKETKTGEEVDPRVVQVAPSGGLKVWLDGMRNTFTVATSAVISSIPSVTIGAIPSLTANPTKATMLAQGLLTAGDVTLHTTAAAYRELEIHLTNVDGTTSRTAQISIGALDDTHSIVKAHPIPVGYRSELRVPGIATATAIHGLCSSANTVAYQIYGVA
jgi:hypothetical protein